MDNISGLRRINKSAVSFKEVSKMLTVPNPEYAKLDKLGKYIPPSVTKTLDFFIADSKYWYVPRKVFTDLGTVDETIGSPAKFNFNITLRDYQQDYFDSNKILDFEEDSFIMNLKTGNGKTVCGLYCLQALQRKTLILCETDYLIKQWRRRIDDFSAGKPKNNNYILINNKTKIDKLDDKDIIICTLKGFSTINQNILGWVNEHVGTLIVDEGHRLGAKTFYPNIEKVRAKYRILLTATFRRKDGMDAILLHSFGRIYSLPNQLPKAKLNYLRTGVRFSVLLNKGVFNNVDLVRDLIIANKEDDFYETVNYFAYTGAISDKVVRKFLDSKDAIFFMRNQYKMLDIDLRKFLDEEQSRRRKLISLIRKAVKQKRRILLPSQFLDTMETVSKALPGIKYFILDGKTNAKITDEEFENSIKDCSVIFGSMKVVEEGMDIDWLDLLIIYLPKSDIEQLVGRITRILEGKPVPQVIVFMDNLPYAFRLIKKQQEFDDNFYINGKFDFSDIIKEL